MKITLTPDLKQTLELRHSKICDVRECDRIKAVLLSSEGGSITQISQALRKHEAIKLGALSKTITHQYKTVNGESICHFLEKIKLAYSASSTLNIVLDSPSYHRSAEGVEKAKSLNIKLHYLPPYSPNLNPIERLWKVMNEQVYYCRL